MLGTALAATLAAVLTSALVLALQLHLALSPAVAGSAALSACVLSMRWRKHLTLKAGVSVDAPPGHAQTSTPSSSLGATWCAPLCAGFVCAVLCLTSTRLGPLVSGLLLGLPLVALCVAVGRHVEAGPAAAAAALRGYPEGLLWRSVFALLLPPALSWTQVAMEFALASASMIALLTGLALWAASSRRTRHWQPPDDDPRRAMQQTSCRKAARRHTPLMASEVQTRAPQQADLDQPASAHDWQQPEGATTGGPGLERSISLLGPSAASGWIAAAQRRPRGTPRWHSVSSRPLGR